MSTAGTARERVLTEVAVRTEVSALAAVLGVSAVRLGRRLREHGLVTDMAFLLEVAGIVGVDTTELVRHLDADPDAFDHGTGPCLVTDCPSCSWYGGPVTTALAELHAAMTRAQAEGQPAPCVGRPEWVSERADDVRHARRQCGECPVLMLCEQAAREVEPDSGVWAGRDMAAAARVRAHYGQRPAAVSIGAGR